jgi:phosphatidylcholine synthase
LRGEYHSSDFARHGLPAPLKVKIEMFKEKLLAWCVHCYTALGLIAAAGMAVLIVRGDEESFRLLIGLMIFTTFIDTTDGWLARRARVKEVVPQVDGRRLDDIIDFQTYTSLPLLFIWRAEILPGYLNILLLAPLLASLYGFSQTNAKTPDNFFLGFPSYWNVIAAYLYWLQPPVWISVGLIITLATLTFVPSFYLYPSRGGPLSKLTTILCLLWGLLLILIVAQVLADARPLIWASLAFPVYYFALSWAITLRRWLGGHRQAAQAENRLSKLETTTGKG